MEEPLTPPEQLIVDKLEQDLQHTPTVKGFKDRLNQIIKDIKDDRAFNQSEFEKGSEKFKELSSGQKELNSEMKEVKSEVSDMKSQVTNSIDGLKNQMAKKEITDLTDEVKALRADKKEKSKNTEKLIYGAIGAFISLVIYNIPSIVSFFANTPTK